MFDFNKILKSPCFAGFAVISSHLNARAVIRGRFRENGNFREVEVRERAALDFLALFPR